MELAYRLILYILIANTGFMLYSLARRGWRANAGYLIQLGLILAFMVIMLIWGTSGFWAVVVSSGCIIVSVVIPFLLQKRLETLLAEQRFDEIENVAWWKAALAWSEVNAHLLAIGRIAANMNESPAAVESELRHLLGKGEPFDGITRLFMAMLHFHQRRFAEIVDDLAAPDHKEEDLSFEEMLYLVRGYLETRRYEDACRIQLLLEQKAVHETSPHTSGNLLVSRLIFFALMGWKEDFNKLLETHPDLRESLPEILRDFWSGVTVYHAGQTGEGIALMEQALQKNAEEIPEHWIGWMRQRIDELRTNIDVFTREQYPILLRLYERHQPDFHQLFTATEPSVAPLPEQHRLTSLLTWAFVACYVASLWWSNPEDILQLIHLGANSSLLVQQGDWYRLVTSLFLHMGLVHLFMNLLALKYFGPPLETVIGGPMFIGVFVFSGVCGSLLSVWHQTSLSVGASGAVLGLLSAAIVIEWAGGNAARRLARYENLGTLLFILGVNLLIGTIEKGIDNSAHLGGLAGGAIAGLLAATIIRLPSLTKVAEALVVLASCSVLAWAGYSYSTVDPVRQYPSSLLPLIKADVASIPITLSMPASWKTRLASDSTQLQELTVMGTFGERLDISWGLNSDPPDKWVRTYAEARARTIAGDELVQLKAISDPATFSAGIWNGYRVQWRLAAQSHPIVIRDYILFRSHEMVLIQCLVPTELVQKYDAVFLKIIESINVKKDVDDEEP